LFFREKGVIHLCKVCFLLSDVLSFPPLLVSVPVCLCELFCLFVLVYRILTVVFAAMLFAWRRLVLGLRAGLFYWGGGPLMFSCRFPHFLVLFTSQIIRLDTCPGCYCSRCHS